MRPRVLVTGSSGFVGRHAAVAIKEDCADAVILPLNCDIADREAVAGCVAEAAPDLCLHLAGIAAVGMAAADPDRAWTVNLHGTLALARALRQHAPACPLVFVSTGEVYGQSFRSGKPLDETGLLAPGNLYAATKAAADLALGAMASDMHVIRLRPSNHTGPGQTADFVVPAFARQIARIAAGQQDPILRTGNLSASRDFLDVRDVARAYAIALARAPSLASGTILNIASGTSRRIGDVLDRLMALAGVAARIETEGARLRATDIPVATGDAGAARRLLGWAPEIPFDQTLADILADWHGRVADGIA